MDFAEFRTSIDDEAPPAGLTPPLEALWHAARGEWDRAHGIAQRAGDAGDKDAEWVHAYLHRVEGDLSNAGYWYRRVGKPEATGSLDDEWAAISAALLERA